MEQQTAKRLQQLIDGRTRLRYQVRVRVCVSVSVSMCVRASSPCL
jgi:hypothetical protein